MGVLRFILIGTGLVFISACATDSPADSAEVKGLIRAFQPECVREIQADANSQRLIVQIDVTAQDFCACLGHEFFGPFTNSDLKRFPRDAARYHLITEHEPWKSRANSTALRCLGGETLSGQQARTRRIDVAKSDGDR